MLVFDMHSNVGCELYPHSVQHQEPIGFVWVWALVVFKGLYIVVHLLHNLKTLDLNFLHGSHCWILGVPASWIYPICFFTFSTFFTFIKSSFFNMKPRGSCNSWICFLYQNFQLLVFIDGDSSNFLHLIQLFHIDHNVVFIIEWKYHWWIIRQSSNFL